MSTFEVWCCEFQRARAKRSILRVTIAEHKLGSVFCYHYKVNIYDAHKGGLPQSHIEAIMGRFARDYDSSNGPSNYDKMVKAGWPRAGRTLYRVLSTKLLSTDLLTLHVFNGMIEHDITIDLQLPENQFTAPFKELCSKALAGFRDGVFDVLVTKGPIECWIYIREECARKKDRRDAINMEPFRPSFLHAHNNHVVVHFDNKAPGCLIDVACILKIDVTNPDDMKQVEPYRDDIKYYLWSVRGTPVGKLAMEKLAAAGWR